MQDDVVAPSPQARNWLRGLAAAQRYRRAHPDLRARIDDVDHHGVKFPLGQWISEQLLAAHAETGVGAGSGGGVVGWWGSTTSDRRPCTAASRSDVVEPDRSPGENGSTTRSGPNSPR